MDNGLWDAVVVGGGPAGLSAALMLGRARRRVLVLDAGSPRNRFAAHMHGVLGLEGVAPGDLGERGRAEVAAYGVEVEQGEHAAVRDVTATSDAVHLVLVDGREVAARALVVATGVVDDLPAIPGLAERWGTAVLHCPYCHGWEVRDRRLGVLLTSLQGLHQAELVRQWSDRVTVFTAAVGDLEPAVERRLRSRGVEVVTEPVAEVLGGTGTITAVRTADGREVPVDAIFTAPRTLPQDGFLAGLGLARTDGPAGSVLELDAMNRTSHERVWAVGNVVQPFANVPLSMGSGSFVGAFVNAALVSWEFDEADVDPAVHWEERYAGVDRAWSGRPNATLVDAVAGLAPGRALDLGSGEGGDAVWLAQQGWTVTGLDISPTAVRRATEAARAAGLDEDRCRFVATDLERWTDGADGADGGDGAGYDLVTASFLHAAVALDRTGVLRRAAGTVAPGGHLLVLSHAAPPPWSSAHAEDHDRAHRNGGPAGHRFHGPEEELAALALDGDAWTTVLAEVRTRAATGPDGQEATLDDTVVLLRRDR